MTDPQRTLKACLALALVACSALAVHAGPANSSGSGEKQITWLDSRLPQLKQAGSSGTAGAAGSPAAPMGNLNQVMRSILFPNANMIFNVQLEDPGEVKAPVGGQKDGFSITTWGDGLYTRWEVVSYAAVALQESATLLMKADRQCQNGKPVPVGQADWAKFSTELSDTAKAVYVASQAKNRDTVVDLTERLNDACASCHNVYRRGADVQRCVAR